MPYFPTRENGGLPPPPFDRDVLLNRPFVVDRITQLAIDIAAAYDVTVDEAVQLLHDQLFGDVEPIRLQG